MLTRGNDGLIRRVECFAGLLAVPKQRSRAVWSKGKTRGFYPRNIGSIPLRRYKIRSNGLQCFGASRWDAQRLVLGRDSEGAALHHTEALALTPAAL